MTKLHPARTLLFRDLVDALRSAREARLVTEQARAFFELAESEGIPLRGKL